MKFNEYKYERINLENIEEKFSKLNNELKNTKDPNEFMKVFNSINKFRGHISTMMTLVSIRHSIDTSDKFYDEENNYWDETAPVIQKYETDFMDICLNYQDRDKLDIPEVFFKLAECSKKVFNESIIAYLQIENKLVSEYDKLRASAKLLYKGKEYNLSSIGKFFTDNNRQVRKETNELVCKYYEENEAKFDEIYDKLVKVRTTIANKLGYKTFTEVGYLRMNRLDYNEEMVSNYRKQILNDVVPLVKKLRNKQSKRIGIEHLKHYDDNFYFKSGNPKPVGDEPVLKAAAQKMYEEMSKETGEFFNMMIENDLFDLTSKPNKQGGGYTTDIYDYNVPFIFSNFRGDSGDVDVLTHEAGHAFQSYMSKDITVPELRFPTLESCEIHSMSMEFFAHPWMKEFFGEDANKYIFNHIESALEFLPYGVLVDHFQHEIYNNPNMTPDERKATWRKLEKMYEPNKDYEGLDILEKGTYFYRQLHIYEMPFYYIDYTLAQVCALQFYSRILNKDAKAWSDYLHLCKLGGTKSFVSLVKEAGLISPFKDGCLKDTVKTMEKVIDSIDDTKF